MPTQNPYTPPQTTTIIDAHQDGVHQDGQYLLIKKRFESHRQCILTGEEISPDAKPRKQNFTKSNPFVIITVIASIVIFGGNKPLLVLIVAVLLTAIFQKTLKAKIYYTPRIIKKKRIATTLSLLSVFGGLGLFLAAILSRPASTPLMITATILIILSPIFAIILRPRPSLSVKKHKKGTFYIKNAHPNYLSHYPLIQETSQTP